MGEEPASPIERAFFGDVGREAIDLWLAGVVHDRLGATVREVVFRAGRIDAVYGVALVGGPTLVLKVHRPPADVGELHARQAVMRHLAAVGYPCPEPVDGPAVRDGRVVTVETMLDRGSRAEAADPLIRRALAASLVEHIEMLRSVGHLVPSLGRGPAWTRYDGGPWPVPHDPIFDFSVTPAGFEWLDEVAARASADLRLLRPDLERLIGHGDWYAGNVLFEGGRVVGVFDWDLVVESEAVLAGMPAGAYLLDGFPAPDQVAAFIADVDDARAGTFSAVERQAARSGALWILAFNARCELSMAGNRSGLAGEEVPPTSAIGRLRASLADYQNLAW